MHLKSIESLSDIYILKNVLSRYDYRHGDVSGDIIFFYIPYRDRYTRILQYYSGIPFTIIFSSIKPDI